MDFNLNRRTPNDYEMQQETLHKLNYLPGVIERDNKQEFPNELGKKNGRFRVYRELW